VAVVAEQGQLAAGRLGEAAFEGVPAWEANRNDPAVVTSRSPPARWASGGSRLAVPPRLSWKVDTAFVRLRR